jgi:predicted XRE-type DNA-binding protein
MVTNLRVRRAMTDAGISQSKLAEILGWTESKVSNVLDVEMSARTQAEIVAKIREQQKGR